MSFISSAHERFRAATEKAPPSVSIFPTAGEYDDLGLYVENFAAALGEFVQSIGTEAAYGGAAPDTSDMLSILSDIFSDFCGEISNRAEELRSADNERRSRR